MCPSEMGMLWHLWSPVLISLTALFSKGEDPATLGPGLTLPGVHVGECGAVGCRERGRGYAQVCVCRHVAGDMLSGPSAAGPSPGGLG